MEALGLTLVDWGVIVAMLLAGLMGLSSGLIHGVLFIASWGAAAVLAWTLRPTLQPHVMEYVADESIAYFASLLGLFVLALIVFTVLAGVIGRVVRKSFLGGVDKLLGFGFGLICGAAVLSLAFIGFIYVYKQGPLLETIEQARSYPLVRRGAILLEPYLPEQLRRLRPPDGGGALPPTGSAPAAPPAPSTPAPR
jgi:membrane protein required for colicin V production